MSADSFFYSLLSSLFRQARLFVGLYNMELSYPTLVCQPGYLLRRHPSEQALYSGLRCLLQAKPILDQPNELREQMLPLKTDSCWHLESWVQLQSIDLKIKALFYLISISAFRRHSLLHTAKYLAEGQDMRLMDACGHTCLR